MRPTHSSAVECPVETAVQEALAYFAVFSYPLTGEEVFAFCTEACATREEVAEALKNLTAQGLAFQFGNFFYLKNDSAVADRRLECNRRATEMLPLARRMARLIGRFPFVRGVFVSGSLSKHCMKRDSDVDFFIVTEPNRLWVARTLLVLFKKIFLFNSNKYFCVNYFVDTQHLEIEEKNRFTATETVTLLPMWGSEWYTDFCRANAWAWAQFPHFQNRPTANVPASTRGVLKKIAEIMWAGNCGNWLDKKAMNLTVNFWKKKFRGMDSDTFALALKSQRGISKHHPQHFQEKVLARFEKNLGRTGGTN